MDRVDYESVVIQDIETFHKRAELNLTPWYQRRSVWTDTQKAYLVNSVFENKPIPTCYIRHYLDVDAEASIKEVVDGQQRIRAILSYLDDEFSAPQEAGGKRLKYSQLSPPEKRRFRMQKISVGYLINADDKDVIDIFGRLNSVAKTLNAQENRNAKFSGSMKQFCLKLGSRYVDFWRETKLFTATEISRMTEVQFVSEITLNLQKGLSDFSQAQLIKLYKDNDEDFPQAAQIMQRFERVMGLMQDVQPSITNTIFSRSPIFFSLFLALDEVPVKALKLRRRIAEIDEIFNEIEDNPGGGSAADVEFHDACVASTQRIKSRRARAKYITAKLKV